MKMRVADYVVKMLRDAGIKDVFTVTGGGAMHLNNAFGKSEKIKCTYNHHEQASAMAAEGYARLSGRMAAVCITSGPGGTNAITGVLGAYLDSIPMIVISGQVKYSTTVDSTGLELRQFGDQEYDICKSVERMTKYCHMVKEANEIRYCIEKALFEAESGRKGPCWVDIPLNIQGEIIDTETLNGFSADKKEFTAKKDDIETLIEKLEKAERPVILAGSGIRLGNAHKRFIKLIEKLKIPVATAWNAHDNLWDDHELYAGRPGTIGDRAGNFVLQKSDFMLALGCRLNIRQISYNYEEFIPNTYLAVVDIDETELKKPSLKIDLPIHADVSDVIDRLLDEEIYFESDFDDWRKWCRQVRDRYPVFLPKHKKSKYGVNVYHFMSQLFLHLQENEKVVASNGSACVCSFQAGILKKGQRLFTNSGCASMGYGLPSAIGCSISENNGRIICIEGDGSLQMNIQELQTVKHYSLPIILFVLNNDGYHSIRQTQANIFAEDPLYGVDEKSGVSFPDLEKIAYAYGLDYYKVDNAKTMDKKIIQALESKSAIIVEVVVDSAQDFEPKLAAIRREDGSIYSPPPYDLSPLIPKEELKELLGVEREEKGADK